MTSRVTIKELIDKGYINPPLKLERTYRGSTLRATVTKEGKLLVGGETVKSLSTAANKAKSSVFGGYHQTNGWTFWRFRSIEEGKIKSLWEIRQEYRNSM